MANLQRKEDKQTTPMFKLFNRHRSDKRPRAVAFVDYEHWYISLDKMYRTKPDIKEWYRELSAKYNVVDTVFFADFSNTALRLEIPRIREVSNTIIETQNASAFHKKDFTDFIMLDHIYQKAINSYGIDTFIIFTGDGHFSSVASFLVTKCGKEVGIYGVKDAVSSQLRNSASWTVEIPHRDEKLYSCITNILSSVQKILDSNKTSNNKKYPTYRGTVDYVSRAYSTERSYVSAALDKLIDENVVTVKEVNAQRGKTIKTIEIDQKAAKKAGYRTE